MYSAVKLEKKSASDKANIVSKIFLTWSFSLFRRGYKKAIRLEDLWQAREHDHSCSLGNRLEEAWHDELQRSKREGTKPSLSRAIVRSFWLEYMMCGIIVGFMFIVLRPIIPYMLALFIEYFAGEKTPEMYQHAHIYNFVMNFLSLLFTLLFNHMQLAQACVGMRVRVACCSLIYRKILKLNRIGLSKTEPGQVINLMSNDVSRFDLAAPFLNYLWVMPIVVPVVSFLVWQRVTYAVFAALALIILQVILVQAYLSNLQGKLRGKIAKRTDERVRVMSELVSGVQVIKMYAWEKPFEKLVDKLRKIEIKYIRQTSMIKGFSTAVSVFTERVILFAAIITFYLMGGHVNSVVTFSLLRYFNQLQLACSIYFPIAMSFLAECKVSIRRIEEFLCLEEINNSQHKEVESDLNSQLSLDSVDTKLLKVQQEKGAQSSALVLTDVCASWDEDPKTEILRNITLTVQAGQLIGVAGVVGAGKTSLLQLILGELPRTKGAISLEGSSISYASQEPWLFVGTVRQNILFGLPYDAVRYKKVVKACSLFSDFDHLPNGDITLVGEKGSSLSGGQRARVGLARACYRQADIYLLDDPLSAVDTHVGKELVTNCVLGLLRHSTRILVTHQLHHLKEADMILLLHNGEIEKKGTFEEMSRTNLFAEVMKQEEPDEAVPPQGRQRAMSVQSHTSSSTINEIEDAEEEQKEDTELMGTGRVSRSIYRKYFRAGGSRWFLIFTVLSIIAAQVITSASDLWLTHWMNDVEINDNKQLMKDKIINSSKIEDGKQTQKLTTELWTTNSTVTTEKANYTLMGTFEQTAMNITAVTSEVDNSFYMFIWAIGILGCIILTTGRSVLFLQVCMRSSIKLHNQMFSNILSATMRFFERNPSGRILNRFSKDMGVVDEILPKMYLDSIQVFMVVTGIVVMVVIVSPYMLLTAAVCVVLMYYWTVVYLSAAQSIKRVEGVSRSPVFSHVSASMAGLPTVRACAAQDMLCRQFDDKQDVHTAAWYLTLVINTAFSIWLSLITSVYIAVVSYTFLLLDDGATKSGNVGLAISQSLILVNTVTFGIRQATDVISQMTSVERIVEFTSLPTEKHEGPAPPKDWPKRAELVFKNLSLRYDTESDPVLKNINISIKSGWKVGVVGRTGAGKSSLIAALFRLAPIEGHVLIDDLDTGDIALQELRSKISIIPQEPVLFSASLRYNMDPFDKYTDADIWEALEKVELKNNFTSLSSAVAAGGSNFSAGQRQLLCLARAALARNRLLVLDEATANVDPNTDTLIQKSIRKHFADCTVLTVAHRLHTVADSDRVVVMEAGQIVECGHPHELLQKADGPFVRMVRQLGPAAEQSLRDLAANAHKQHVP